MDSGLIDLTGAISVTSYNAKGNGVTDEINALRQAVQAASGKTLLIDPGTYLMAGLMLKARQKST